MEAIKCLVKVDKSLGIVARDKEVKRVIAAHGLSVVGNVEYGEGTRGTEAIFHVEGNERNVGIVGRWFNEPGEAPYAPGSLLFYQFGVALETEPMRTGVARVLNATLNLAEDLAGLDEAEAMELCSRLREPSAEKEDFHMKELRDMVHCIVHEMLKAADRNTCGKLFRFQRAGFMNPTPSREALKREAHAVHPALADGEKL